MSPITQLSILALAAGALAVPNFRNVNHHHDHQHLHSSYQSGSAVATGTTVTSDGVATVYNTVHVTRHSETASSSSAFPTLSTFNAVAKGHRQRSSKVSSAAIATSAVSVATTATSVAVASTTAATSSAAAVATSTSGKRGLAYNDASLTHYFSGSQITWAYNWGSATTNLVSGLQFIPLLWGTGSDFTSAWAVNAAAAIATGSQYLFSFNEPDLSSQANLSPAVAAAAYKTYMQPFAGKAKLCAPSVTNGGGAMGLTWLSNFLDACTDCQIDCVAIHWYDSYTNVEYFKEHVANATAISGLPVFVSEFGTVDGTDDNISSFLQQVMPWMDSNSNVLGYSYFMVSDGLLVSGTAPSSFGSTYMSYTS